MFDAAVKKISADGETKDKNTKMGQFCVSIWLGYSTQLLNQKLDVATKVFL